MSFCCGKFISEIKCIIYFLTKLYLVQYCQHNWITTDKNGAKLAVNKLMIKTYREQINDQNHDDDHDPLTYKT